MTAKTETLKIQNLSSFHFTSGITEVHATGCSHKIGRSEPTGSGDYTSKEAYGVDHWSDINAEMVADGQPEYDWQDGELSFKNCVKLPDWEDGDAGEHFGEEGRKTGSQATRASAREVLYNSMVTCLDGMKADVANGHQPVEMLTVMTEQVERVAKMFGLR
jgi:hypothetical protein